MAARFTEDEVLAATGARRLAQVARGGSASSPFEVCTDTRKLSPGCLFVALKGERFDAHDFLHKAVEGGAGALLVEEGHSVLPSLAASAFEGVGVYAVADTLQGLGALARFHRRRFGADVPVGAVGGSNGKTTTKEMVAAILETRGPALRTQGNFNNEVGLPLTLFGFGPEHVAAVLELGMNLAGEMDRLTRIAEPHAAVLTVIQPEHLEGLGTLEGVAKAETELFRALGSDATAVVNLDEPLIAREASGLRCKVVTFGRHEKADVRLVDVEKRGRDGLLARVQEGGRVWEVPLAFLGEHNAFNATAAFALARALGYSAEACVTGLGNARPYARRLNVLDAPGGLVVLDDCYNANTQSVIAALDTVRDLAASQGGRAVAVLGDMLELGPGELDEHRQVGRHASAAVELLALFGPRSKSTCEAAGKGAQFEDVGALVEWLRPQLRERDVVLVKGSRGMRLERVVDALMGRNSSSGQGGGAH